MHAILILGGKSRRFWPLCEKPLTVICGKTLAEHQLEKLTHAGIPSISIVASRDNRPALQKVFRHRTIITQADPHGGMRAALLSALPKVKKGPVLIVSGNDLIDPSAYQKLMKAAAKPGVAGAILAKKQKEYFPGGYLTIRSGHILSIVEKPRKGREPSSLVTIVAHLHNDPKTLLKMLRATPSSDDDGYERALGKLFKAHRYVPVLYDDFWQAVKYPWHLLAALPHFLDQIKKPALPRTAKVHPSAVIEGAVIFEEGVRVLPHATIVGPAFIGKGTIVGTGALVRGASVGENCVIGFGTEVKGSILGSNVWTHMSYIGDSVIAGNVSFGGGSMTGNFRLDEGEVLSLADGERLSTGLTKFGAVIGEGCRLGIHTSIAPGIKIGAGSFIASAVSVSADVPEKSYVTMEGGKMHIRPNRAPVPTAASRERFRPKKRG